MNRETFNLKYAKPMLEFKNFMYHPVSLAMSANRLISVARCCLHGTPNTTYDFDCGLGWVASYAYEDYKSKVPDRSTYQSYTWFVQNEFIPAIANMFDLKGAEYTEASKDDRLQNFKMVADESERLDALSVWYVYVMKHIISLVLFARQGVAKSEPIFNRCVDVAAYLILGKALSDEVNNRVLS